MHLYCPLDRYACGLTQFRWAEYHKHCTVDQKSCHGRIFSLSWTCLFYFISFPCRSNSLILQITIIELKISLWLCIYKYYASINLESSHICIPYSRIGIELWNVLFTIFKFQNLNKRRIYQYNDYVNFSLDFFFQEIPFILRS